MDCKNDEVCLTHQNVTIHTLFSKSVVITIFFDNLNYVYSCIILILMHGIDNPPVSCTSKESNSTKHPYIEHCTTHTSADDNHEVSSRLP